METRSARRDPRWKNKKAQVTFQYRVRAVQEDLSPSSSIPTRLRSKWNRMFGNISFRKHLRNNLSGVDCKFDRGPSWPAKETFRTKSSVFSPEPCDNVVCILPLDDNGPSRPSNTTFKQRKRSRRRCGQRKYYYHVGRLNGRNRPNGEIAIRRGGVYTALNGTRRVLPGETFRTRRGNERDERSVPARSRVHRRVGRGGRRKSHAPRAPARPLLIRGRAPRRTAPRRVGTRSRGQIECRLRV